MKKTYFPVNESATCDKVDDFIEWEELPDFIRDEMDSGVDVTFYFTRKRKSIIAETSRYKFKFKFIKTWLN